MAHASTPDATAILRRFHVPDDPRWFAAAGDANGRAWIAGLPALVDMLRARWRLTLEDGGARFGYHALVLPVMRGGDPCVLKLTWQTRRTVIEARALAVWDGHGAVRLLAADTERGALLLERLDAGRTLADLEVFAAAAEAGRLMRRLTVPAPPGIRGLRDFSAGVADSLESRQARLGHPVPARWLELARRLAGQLGAEATDQLLVHGDLHYGNVLAGEREPWLAIDPKPIAGEPEYGVPELLWTRADEVSDAVGIRRLMAILVESAELDAARARCWAIARGVDYWLWGLEHGLTDDPERCRRMLAAFAGAA